MMDVLGNRSQSEVITYGGRIVGSQVLDSDVKNKEALYPTENSGKGDGLTIGTIRDGKITQTKTKTSFIW